MHVSSDVVAFGFIGEAVPNLEQRLEKMEAKLANLIPGGESNVTLRVIRPPEQSASAEDLVRSIWADLFRRRVEFDVEGEISSLISGELTLKEAKTALERRYIMAELSKSQGNITRAAESLGVHRPQLSNLIKKHHVRREEFA